jgi:hypothetical protein
MKAFISIVSVSLPSLLQLKLEWVEAVLSVKCEKREWWVAENEVTLILR